MKPGPDLFLLSPLAGWRSARVQGLTPDPASGALELSRLPGTARPLVDAAGTFGGLVLPRALAADPDGNLYILDAGLPALKRYDPCTETFHTLPCAGGEGDAPRQFRQPNGLARSRFGDLIVADTGNRRVQVFTEKGLALRLVLGPYRVTRPDGQVRLVPVTPVRTTPAIGPACQPATTLPPDTWEPWDVAADPCGRFFVADRAHGLVHIFNAAGCWQASWDGASADSPALVRPTRLAIDSQRRLYILQKDRDDVTVLDSTGKFVERIEQPQDVAGRFRPLALAVDEAGNLYLSSRVTRRVHVICRSDPCSARTLPPTSPFPAECTSIAFDPQGNPLLGDARQRCVVRFEPPARYLEEGRWISQALDSEIHDCTWHRVLLTADVPRGTQIQVDTFTAPAWKSAAEISALPESRWQTRQTHAGSTSPEWDCLIASPPGRFLWLRLSFRGETTSSPRLTRIRLQGPRVSSLRHLPAAYAEDPAGADFIARFLSIFDTLRGQTTELLDRLAAYFDPRAVPTSARSSDDFLAWLASWIGLALDRHWPEAQRRALLQHAHRLYALRGTAAGLRLHLRLYTGLEPHLLEHFRVRRWLELDHGRLGDQSRLFGPAVVRRLQLDEHAAIGSFQLTDTGDPLRDPFHYYAHQFTVFVPVRTTPGDPERQTILRIVEMAKPAHALARVEILAPRFQLGCRSVVGLDTLLGRYPSGVRAGDAQLGHDTVLSPSPDEAARPHLRLGTRSRLGSTLLLD